MVRKFLEELRSKGWKQTEIAAKAGIKQSAVSRLSKGGECNAETLIRLADAFEVTVDEVLGRKPTKTLSPIIKKIAQVAAGDKEIERAALKCAKDEKLLKEVRGKGKGEKQHDKDNENDTIVRDTDRNNMHNNTEERRKENNNE